MNPITTLTGEVNLRTASAKAFVFHCPRAGSKAAEERPLGLAAKSPQSCDVVRAISPFPSVVPSVQGYPPEVGGKMVRMDYEVADGEVVKVFGQRRPGTGKLPVSANLFLRVRAGAALREITVKLLTDACVTEPYAKVRGRFDLLTLDEALELGCKVHPNFRRAFDPAAVAHIMEATVLAPEKAVAQTVVRADGTAAVVIVEKRRRRLNMGA